MKTEEKELVCEWLDKLGDDIRLEWVTVYLNQFKADNDLIVKDELEFGRWICSDAFNNELFMYDNVNGLLYGVNANDEWICDKLNDCCPNYDTDNRYATSEEIESKLSAMAEKMGYIKGVEVVSAYDNTTKSILTNGFKMYSGTDLCAITDDVSSNITIMKNGKWAEIISTPNRELSKQEWNERIGLDEHVKALTDLGYIVTVKKK